jgi:DNA-binding LacI/PurR family transcriptional regulator
MKKLHDFEVTRVAAEAICKRETVRTFLRDPSRMKPATRARVEAALQALGYFASQRDGDVP